VRDELAARPFSPSPPLSEESTNAIFLVTIVSSTPFLVCPDDDPCSLKALEELPRVTGRCGAGECSELLPRIRLSPLIPADVDGRAFKSTGEESTSPLLFERFSRAKILRNDPSLDNFPLPFLCSGGVAVFFLSIA
jgi:hypothetical protein